ncbi:MAG: DNA adenine methylase [Candidatus Pacebacteria bacterium]|nr:DNA adenine methylase [Candidatus Paceibacterota bacterium]
MMKRPKSIFRYPGGKLKAIKYIKPFWEAAKHSEYREPFVGGGSVFISKPLAQFNWINDIDTDMTSFYTVISNQKSREKLISELKKIEINKKNYDYFFNLKTKNQIEKAKRIYILNRCSFSGITVWNSFIGDVRYNIDNAQHTIRDVGEKLEKTKITSLDFEEIIEAKPHKRGAEVFMFIDPPYVESRQVAAYKHAFTMEDHIRLAKILKKTKYKFLLTYDDCKFTREKYNWAHLYKRTWTYSVANSKVHHNPRESGNELFISNFPLPDEFKEKEDLKEL